MIYPIDIPPIVGQVFSILFMTFTILIGNFLVLKIEPAPVWKALVIATVSNLLGKLFVSVLHFPAYISYTLPTIAFLGLSYAFFKPEFKKMLLYWIVGFAAYLLIHANITLLFGWTFMFPFWDLRNYFN